MMVADKRVEKMLFTRTLAKTLTETGLMLAVGRRQTIRLPPFIGLWPSGQDVDRNRLMLSVGRRQIIWRPPYVGLCPRTLLMELWLCIDRRLTIWHPPYFALWLVVCPLLLYY
ncbi:hypothetical protein DPMN_147165 [Dreissena polymorpha]|uniref:Uncharacterized protein n=1 Tax=Dreissena polymorpha TaxID=45954 RepID=A0A9D4F9C3_DREPO|nr:hypothetical protein DPMN_147165 [Dreissena polymorpha]